MSSINSAVGLVSGLPIGDLVERLVSSQRQQISLVDGRVKDIATLRTALLDLSARLLSLKSKGSIFKNNSFFRAAQARASIETALRATVTGDATPGEYRVIVRQLASTHQLLGNGFATANATYLTPGTVTLESAAGRIDNSTALSLLRGGEGVRGGIVRVRDRSGATTDIDLTLARNVEDVLAAINGQSAVAVRARVQGDRLILEDQSGSTSGPLTVTDLGGGHAAADLGLAGSSPTGTLTSGDLVSLSRTIRLDQLNDGNGIRRSTGGGDIRIQLSSGESFDVDLSGNLTSDTQLSVLNGGAGVSLGTIKLTNHAGASAQVDLSGARTIGDVLAAINASGIGLTASLSGSSLLISDASAGQGATTVEDVGSGTTARDLGLLAPLTNGVLKGSPILRIDTFGDVLNAINRATGNAGRVTAAISDDGDGITLTDATTGGESLRVVGINGSRAAIDLGLFNRDGSNGRLQSTRLLSGLNTVLLRTLHGGTGIGRGILSITDRSGLVAEVDLGNAQTLADVIDAINNAGTGIRARVSDSGLGLLVTDSSGGSGALRLVDLTGSAARDLGIEFSGDASTAGGANLQRQYISENTRLDQLDSGRGIPRGRFRITNAAGQSALVDLTQGNENTVGDVIREINSRGIGVAARINDTGDGILLEDRSTGAGRLTVAEDGGTTARALRLLGTARSGTHVIDGAYETRIDVSATDTLTTLAARIQAAGGPAGAAVINDGSPTGGFHLTLTSGRSGVTGRLAIDTGTTGLSFSTLVRGRDSAVQIGGEDGNPGITLTSPTNSIDGAIAGVRLDLLSVSAAPVVISVTGDTQSITDKVNEFVQSFNAILSRIDDLSNFNADTGNRGVLLGDRSADEVRRRLSGLLSLRVPDVNGAYSRLSQVGFSFSNGRLKFDAAKFNTAYVADPESVAKLFTQEKTGVAAKLEAEINTLTQSSTGTLARRSETLSQTTDSLNQRKTQLQSLLASRQARLLAQFQATEAALARLQSQQSSINALAGLASSFSTSTSTSGSGSSGR